MTYIPHLITLLLCVAVLFSACVNFYFTIKFTRKDLIQVLILMALGFQVGTISFFAINQTIWVVSQHDQLVGSVSSVAWLLYDYLNLLFHLSCGTILYYYLDCRRVVRRAVINKNVCNSYVEEVCPIYGVPELDKIRKQLGEIADRNGREDAGVSKDKSNCSPAADNTYNKIEVENI